MKKITKLVLMLCLTLSGALCFASGVAEQENEKAESEVTPADLYDVRDISTAGEIRTFLIRDIRSSSFDAYQSVRLKASRALADTTATATGRVEVDATDVDRAVLTAGTVTVNADTIDAGLVTADKASLSIFCAA